MRSQHLATLAALTLTSTFGLATQDALSTIHPMLRSIGKVPVAFVNTTSMYLEEANYTPFNQTTKILAKGSSPVSVDYPPLPGDILYESDVPVTLRDGTVIYTDIYRPSNNTNGTIPAIVAYSPYGKRGGFFNYDMFQPPNAIERMNVSYEWVSGLEKFEGPNPAWWVNKGYAVIHPDPRGVFHSNC
ncbi:hydrolase family protein [Fusarium langsethiae]|uniref:Hydrolase family protein n=1 Tax=Fusarium langsethiae TaxID=179993 RepID=A0A0N0DAH4_FUSLA|nr:hydrolase family protein [Fusarium langsethiae]GKU17411.1 unnamed protein product [Fusarium langsethiae]